MGVFGSFGMKGLRVLKCGAGNVIGACYLVFGSDVINCVWWICVSNSRV